MADFLTGESVSEEIRICPYDRNHKIKLKSMEIHLEKCRDRNRPKQYAKCPYNSNHVKFIEELPLHIEICPDYHFYGKMYSVDDSIGRKDTQAAELRDRDVEGEEDWDDAEPTTYDPLTTKIKDARFKPKNLMKRQVRIYNPDASVVISRGETMASYHRSQQNQIEENRSGSGSYCSDFDLDFLKDQEQGYTRVKRWLQQAPTEPDSSPLPTGDELLHHEAGTSAESADNFGRRLDIPSTSDWQEPRFSERAMMQNDEQASRNANIEDNPHGGHNRSQSSYQHNMDPSDLEFAAMNKVPGFY